MRTFPLAPRTTRSLLPGDFWAIPLQNGRFACGRVIQTPDPAGSRMLFLAGLLSWTGSAPPSASQIAGANCVAQGRVHVKTIAEGGGVLGNRALAEDSLEPWHFRGSQHWRNSIVFHGLHPLRQQLPADANLPVLSVWGYAFIVGLASSLRSAHSDA